MRLFYLLPLLLFWALLSGCTQKKFETLEWRQGDDIKSLNALNSLSLPVPDTIQVQNEKYDYMEQVHQGFPVSGTFVKKVARSSGQWLSVSAIYRKDLPILDRSSLDNFKNANSAKLKALTLLPSVKQFESFRAVWGEAGHLIWVGDYFDNFGFPHRVQFSSDFKIIAIKPLRTGWFEKTALLYPMGPKLSNLKEIRIRNISVRPQLRGDSFTIDNEQGHSFDPSQSFYSFAPEDPRFDSLQVFFYVEQVQKWSKDKLGFALQIPLNIRLQVGFPEQTNAAFYYNGNIRFGSGDGVVYSKIAQDASIVSHEIFHSLIQTLAHLPYEGEGGSLNEAFADFYTSQLLKRPYLGESAFLQGPYKRSLDQNKKWQDKAGGLYGDSLIISGLLWELSQNLPQEKILPISLKTLARLNPASDFADFNRELRLLMREHLSDEELKKSTDILEARGFPRE